MMNEKGRLSVMVEPGKLEYREYDLPVPEKGAILVKVLRTNVCGSDVHNWMGKVPMKIGTTLGHEMIGRIVRLGEGVTKDNAGNPIKVGDRVVCTYFQICNRCKACMYGNYASCENTYEFFVKKPDEFPHFHGTFSTHYYIQPGQFVYKVPDDLPDYIAVGANCAVSQVLYGLARANLRVGETLVIQGAGGLGLYATAIAKASGAKVIIIDGVKARLEQAKKFGADYVIDLNKHKTVEERKAVVMDITGGMAADVGIELSGVPDAFSEGFHHIRESGRYVSIGNIIAGAFTKIDPAFLTKKSIVIYPINRYEPGYLYRALQFLSANIDKFPFEDLVHEEFQFDELETALDKSVRKEVTRASIVME